MEQKYPGALYPPPHAVNKATIKWLGKPFDVGTQYETDDFTDKREYWVECIDIGGVWLGVAEIFLPSVCAELNQALDTLIQECRAEKAAP